MFKRRKVFFKNVDIDNLFCIFRQKSGCASEEHDGRLMVSSTKPQRNTKCFNGASCYTRIF